MVIVPPETWRKVRLEYKQGKGSLEYLSLKYKIPLSTIKKRSSREGWNAERDRLGSLVVQQQEVTSLEAATNWVEKIKSSCEKDMERIEKSFAMLEDTVDPVGLRHLVVAKKALDDMMRRSLGLPDAPVKSEVNMKVQAVNESHVLDTWRREMGAKAVKDESDEINPVALPESLGTGQQQV